MVTETQAPSRAKICQTCGDEGYKALLHCCLQCRISFEHRYCFARNPANVDEYFPYICSKCVSISVNQSSPKRSSIFCHPLPRLRKPKRPRVEQPPELVDDLEVPKDTLSLPTPVLKSTVEGLLSQTDLDHSSPSNRDVSEREDGEEQTIPPFPRTLVLDSPSEREDGEEQTIPTFPQTLVCDPHVKDLHTETKRRSRKPEKQIFEHPADLVDDDVIQIPTGSPPSPPTQIHKPFVEEPLDYSKRYGSGNSKETESQTNLLSPIPQTLICDPHVKHLYPEIKSSVNDREFQSAPVATIEHPLPKPYAQPIIEPSWRGCFEICGAKIDDLAAHLSSDACFEVVETVKLMPTVLITKMIPRLEFWPKSFSETPPTDENIGLYLFPGSENAVKAFDQMMGQIIKLDMGLKVLLDNAELLLFPSTQLPGRNRRFNGKYYLWGAFRARQDTASSSSSRCSVSNFSRKIDKRIGSPESLTTYLDSPSSTSSISALASKVKTPTVSTRMIPSLPSTKTSSYSSIMSSEKEEGNKLQKVNEKINTLPLRAKIGQRDNTLNWRTSSVSPLIKVSSNEKLQISDGTEQRARSVNQPKVTLNFNKEHFNPFQPIENLVKKNRGQKEVSRLVQKDFPLPRPQTIENSVKKSRRTNAEKCAGNMKNHPRGEEGTWKMKRGGRGRNRSKKSSNLNEETDYCYFCKKPGHLKSQCWTYARAVKERKIAV